jgi:hypothetical protein
MAQIKKGILGAFSGTVGTVVGSVWKGRAVMKSLPSTKKTVFVESQLRQQEKFKKSIQFLTALKAIIDIGWAKYANGKTAVNAAMSFVLKNCFDLDDQLDYSKVLIAKGSLLLPSGVKNIVQTANNLTFQWDVNSAPADALAFACLYCPARRDMIGFTESADTGTVNLEIPSHWEGDVHGWIFFSQVQQGKEIHIPAKKVMSTNSAYCGNISIPVAP